MYEELKSLKAVAKPGLICTSVWHYMECDTYIRNGQCTTKKMSSAIDYELACLTKMLRYREACN